MSKTATDKVYDALHEMISSKKLFPEQQLVETTIAKSLGVSRTPVREAIRRLERDGLVESIPNKGCFLKRNTFSEMADGYEIIAHLSYIACGHLAQEHDILKVSDVDKLRTQIREMKELCQRNEKRKWVEYDTEFHKLLINMTGRTHLINTHAQLTFCVNQVLWFVTPLFIDIQASTSDHEHLLDLILSGDVQQASAFALQHHINTVDVIRNLHRFGIDETNTYLNS